MLCILFFSASSRIWFITYSFSLILFFFHKILSISKFLSLNFKFDIFTSILGRKNSNKQAKLHNSITHSHEATYQPCSLPQSRILESYICLLSLSSNLNYSPSYCSLSSSLPLLLTCHLLGNQGHCCFCINMHFSTPNSFEISAIFTRIYYSFL